MERAPDILLVEDETVVTDAVKRILSADGFKVDAVCEVAHAIAKLKTNSYAVILSDLMLPKLTGFDLIETVRETDRKIPIIMITGYATFENTMRSFRRGVFDFLPKPFDLEALSGVVDRAIRYSGLKAEGNAPNVREAEEALAGSAEQGFCLLGGHAWVQRDREGTALVGAGETFWNTVNTLDRLEVPDAGVEVAQGHAAAYLIARNHHIHTVWAPLSGRIIETNPELTQHPDLLHRAPLGRGWLLRMIPTNLENELENLTERLTHKNPDRMYPASGQSGTED